MTAITRRFTITTQADANGVTLNLGTAVEWESANIVLELASLPVGNVWLGELILQPDASNASRTFAGRRLDLVAAKASSAVGGKTRWIKLGTGTETADHTIICTCDTLPAGNWWDGKLRLFVQKNDARPRHAAAQPSPTEHC